MVYLKTKQNKKKQTKQQSLDFGWALLSTELQSHVMGDDHVLVYSLERVSTDCLPLSYRT